MRQVRLSTTPQASMVKAATRNPRTRRLSLMRSTPTGHAVSVQLPSSVQGTHTHTLHTHLFFFFFFFSFFYVVALVNTN